MPTTHTLVIGAGQAGLAASRSLADADVDHVVLERGRVAERWRSHRWEALRLLTPNWATRLPGWSYQGPQPDGYMTATELARYLTDYAGSFAAPVHERSPVRSLERVEGGYAVHTDDTRLAGGQRRDRDRVVRRAPRAGGGGQARPDHRAGHHLVVPQPRRAPRRPRPGRRRLRHRRAARRRARPRRSRRRAGRRPPQPSPAVLPGRRHLVVARPDRHVRPDHRPGLRPGTVPPGGLRAADRPGRPPRCRPARPPTAGRAPGRAAGGRRRRPRRLRGRPAGHHGRGRRAARADPPPGRRPHPCARPGRRGAAPAPRRPVDLTERIDELDLRDEQVGAVVWATGFTRPYPWLHVPVLDQRGEISQRRGITPHAGLYVLGQRFQHRGDSNFIDGVRHDAAHVARHIASRLQSHEPIAS